MKSLIYLIVFTCLNSEAISETSDPCLSVSGGKINSNSTRNNKKTVRVIIPYTIEYCEAQTSCQSDNTNDIHKIAPHFAKYNVKLLSTEDESVKKVTGVITIRVFENAGGWALEQHNNIIVEYADGMPETIKTSVVTWEKEDGKAYRFFTRRIINGEEVDVYRGDAKIDEDGIGYVSYQIPQSLIIKLPRGTLFPLSYMMKSLKASMEGKSIFASRVFNGASELLEPQEISCFLGPSKSPKMSFSDPDIYSSSKVWPLVMAFYSSNEETPDSEYELVYNLLNYGVIRDMTVNYGTFTVKATISSLKIFHDQM